MNILNELWYGNIAPCDRVAQKDSEYEKSLQDAIDKTEAFLASLPQQQRPALENLVDAHMQAAVIAERDAFVQGFRLAVQLTADSLRG